MRAKLSLPRFSDPKRRVERGFLRSQPACARTANPLRRDRLKSHHRARNTEEARSETGNPTCHRSIASARGRLPRHAPSRQVRCGSTPSQQG